MKQIKLTDNDILMILNGLLSAQSKFNLVFDTIEKYRCVYESGNSFRLDDLFNEIGKIQSNDRFYATPLEKFIDTLTIAKENQLKRQIKRKLKKEVKK